MALLVVLWILALLTILATLVTSRALTSRRVAERYLQAEQSRLLIDSAIRLTMFRLTGGQRNPNSAVPRSSIVTVADTPVNVAVSLESERVDLNSASPSLLTDTFRSLGWQSSDAETFSKKIVEWRTPAGDASQSTPGAGGAAADQNGRRFETVAELRRVCGDSRIGDMTLDRFTVYTHSAEPRWDETSAGVRANREFTPLIGDAVATSVSPDQFIRPDAGELLHVDACLTSPMRRRCRQAVIRLTGNDRRPWQIFRWD